MSSCRATNAKAIEWLRTLDVDDRDYGDARDFGKGCFCTKRSVPCPAHVEQVHRCDYCATQVSGLNGNVLLDRPNGSPSTACAACRESWAQWHSVAFEQWQATRVTAAESTSPPGPPPTPREPQR